MTTAEQTAAPAEQFERHASEAVETVFGPHGLLAGAGREVRDGQLAVARAVAQCFDETRAGLIEGPPGTGKTFAYLTAALAAAQRGQRTVVAVSTNALLDQIALDIPRLADLTGMHVRFAKLKGRAHYVCQHNADGAREVLDDPEKFRLRPEYAQQLGRLLAWIGQGNADLTSYDEKPAEPVRRLVTINSVDCREARDRDDGGCPYAGEDADEESGEPAVETTCHFLRARAEAQTAQIVVTNVDLLLLNFELGGSIFGTFDAVILDEAHEVPSKVRDHFADLRGIDAFLDAGARLRDLAERAPMPPVDPDATDEERNAALLAFRAEGVRVAATLEAAAHELFEQMRAYARARTEEKRDDADLEVLLGIAHGLSGDALEAAAVAAQQWAEHLGDGPDSFGRPPKSDARKHARQISTLLRGDDANLARWVQVHRGPRYESTTLHFAPVDLTRYLRGTIHSRRAAVVAVSATLSPDGRWEHPRAALAMPEDAVTCLAPSPYDFARQAIWFTPADMPKPATGGRARDAYNEAARTVARELVKQVGGRSLVLCSATKDVAVAASAISFLGFEVLVQNERPPAELARRFKADRSSCLVGSKTFGTGFDVPGDALECVILWKLPFAKQTPVDEVLKERLGSGLWFQKHYLPAMLIELKQWVGRLVRCRDDIGVVAILDSQAASGRYGRDVERALPRAIRRAHTLEQVGAFLTSARAWRRTGGRA